MPRRGAPRRLLPLVLGAAWTVGCGGAPPDTPSDEVVSVTDAEGREVSVSVPATRIVSLVPSATLTLAALGARDALVGRTSFDTATWTRPIPSVGGGLNPTMEAIVALEPDLVIRFGGEQDPETPRILDELGIPHVAIRPDGIEDVFETTRLIGRVTAREAEADSMVARLRAELAAVREAVPDGPAPRVVYALGGTPPWVAGPGTYIHELIELAGGVNVFEDLGKLYASVSPEEFVAREIDVVLVPRGSPFPRDLVPGSSVREVGDALELPGPAVAEAAREVARLIHGTHRP